jgi:hypothetical protein
MSVALSSGSSFEAALLQSPWYRTIDLGHEILHGVVHARVR